MSYEIAEEIWRPHPEYERYSVSTYGRVRGPKLLLEGWRNKDPRTQEDYGISQGTVSKIKSRDHWSWL